MPDDAESPPEAGPETRETRLTRLSLKAFASGSVGAIVFLILFVSVVWHAIFHDAIILRMHDAWVQTFILLSLPLVAPSVASLIVSVVWGLRVANSRPHVLMWVVPAGLVMALFVVEAVWFVAVASSSDFWGSFVGIVIVLMLVRSMVLWVLRGEARRNQPGL